jgi:hypothetical protein
MAAMELQLASAMVSKTERERERMGERQRGERSARFFPIGGATWRACN